MKKNKVAIYIRVSTKKQVEEGYSLESQREKLIQIAETNGYIVYKVYADEGKSGKDTNRPAFQEMMEDMRNGKFDKILVLKLDRISRSVIDLEIMIKEFQKYKVEFESASEKIDTSTSFGMMFIRLLAIFAQFERERIKERINDTFETMVQEGKAISGTAPFGYINDENNKVIIDENMREPINYFYDTYEKYQSMRKAVIYTNEKFCLNKLDRSWGKLLTQTTYYGSYKGNDNYCPAYITKERWERLQEIRNSKHVKVYGANNVYIFSGLIIDKHCHTKMSGSTSRQDNQIYYYYRCGRALASKQCISTFSVAEKKLEKFLVSKLNNYIDNYFNQLELNYEQYKDKYKDNSKKIADIKGEMERTTNSYNKGRMTEEKYDKEYIRLEKELIELEKEPVKKDITKLRDLRNIDWQTMYNELSRENKQAFWRSFIDRIEVDPLNYKKGEEYIKIIFL